MSSAAAHKRAQNKYRVGRRSIVKYVETLIHVGATRAQCRAEVRGEYLNPRDVEVALKIIDCLMGYRAPQVVTR